MKMIDLKRIRVEIPDAEEETSVSKPKNKPRKIGGTIKKETEPFISGPLPLSWLVKAARLSKDHILSVWLLILYVKGLGKKSIVLDRFIFNLLGVKKDSARRALERLQKAGLIECRKDGKKFVVTIIDRRILKRLTTTPHKPQEAI